MSEKYNDKTSALSELIITCLLVVYAESFIASLGAKDVKLRFSASDTDLWNGEEVRQVKVMRASMIT